ncbi:Transcriptional regulator protein [Sphingobium herbicidovorans NBRC 16415]|uniref:Transcriptional regulator protein n=1 Tax=Sphingobium herbicidovorans (strain ATCC 700291 / DSM 11019 / CCUG 56400 / KCTC 2939 / LMG 18315 / NBRC 16415 / MH) TaxID=1219045 RepID=A0A086P6R3_SPHHM|nr:TetR/AcrR family transcriptional regulator [Sphingobium herbicidovorans]KFG89081.1 Transcriptional regulator protein [Sphingobium herbicidovorans NBRC 16415]
MEHARSRGRPRQAELQDRLISSALDVLATNGITGLTVERVCALAGVPKTTFYRRWSKPFDAVVEGILSRPRELTYVDEGNAVRDLSRFYNSLAALYSDPIWLAWESLSRCEPSVRSNLAAQLEEEGRQRREHNKQALGNALNEQRLDAALAPGLILNVLNGVARNSAGLRWHTAESEVQELILRLIGLGLGTNPALDQSR